MAYKYISKKSINIPIPKIYVYEKNYTIMEKLYGKNFWNENENDYYWNKLDIKTQKNIITKITKYIGIIHNSYNSNKIGCINFINNNIEYHKCCFLINFWSRNSDININELGPFDNTIDFIYIWLKLCINAVSNKEIKDKLLLFNQKIIQDKSFFKVSNKKFTFTHGDISLANIIINENNTISGFIDWSLSGFYPNIVEYFSLIRYFKYTYRNDIIWNHLLCEINNFCPQLILTNDEYKLIDILIDIFLNDGKNAINNIWIIKI